MTDFVNAGHDTTGESVHSQAIAQSADRPGPVAAPFREGLLSNVNRGDPARLPENLCRRARATRLV